MSLMICYMMICMIMTIALMSMGQILPSHNPDIQKVSPYECGFDPIKSSRLPFSFRFFLMALLFLLFDLEMAMLLPLPFSTSLSSINKSTFPLIAFLSMLSLGLIYEWMNGGLDWAKN